ncbi:MAG: heliorhodopsin HeR [Thermoleophilia bacterium]|nr:heliorhodopsin HeR [Thermoleophilia bacterium]
MRRFNALLAPLHLVQGILMLALSSAFALPITTSFLSEDPAQLTGPPGPDTIVDLRIGPLVAVFLLLSAVAHATLALPRVHSWYEANLERGINIARWVEYSLSASVMIVVIALLVGIFDLAALIALFAVNAAMILFGLMMELHNQHTERTSWVAFWLGTIMGAVPWIAIGIYLIGAGVDGDVPGFVYGIYGSIFVFFNVFAINMVLQYRKVGRWRDYLYGERAYMLLSLFAKSALAWQVFAGTLR